MLLPLHHLTAMITTASWILQGCQYRQTTSTHGATATALPAVDHAQDKVVNLEDPTVSERQRSKYWEPKLVSTDRLFLLPLTTRFASAWEAVHSQGQEQQVKERARLEDTIYDAEHRDRRVYAVFRRRVADSRPCLYGLSPKWRACAPAPTQNLHFERVIRGLWAPVNML